jgi:hypothetical protein
LGSTNFTSETGIKAAMPMNSKATALLDLKGKHYLVMVLSLPSFYLKFATI